MEKRNKDGKKLGKKLARSLKTSITDSVLGCMISTDDILCKTGL